MEHQRECAITLKAMRFPHCQLPTANLWKWTRLGMIQFTNMASLDVPKWKWWWWTVDVRPKKKESINLKLKTTIRNQHNKFSIHDWCGAVVHEDTSSVYLWMWMPLSPMDQSKNCMWDQVTIFDTCAHAELVGILFRDVLRFRDFSRKKVMDWCPACETARCFTNWNRPDLEASSKRQITEVLTNHVMED